MSESNGLKTKSIEGLGFRMEYLPGTKEPLFIDTTAEGAPHKDKPFVERNAIMAIVKNPVTGEYLGLKWNSIDWKTLITGGVEEGETAEEAARKEILEETGYKNVKLVRELTTIHSKFYHGPKKENRFAHFTVLFFELENTDHAEVSEKERTQHEAHWLTPSQMDGFGLLPAHQFAWNEGKE